MPSSRFSIEYFEELSKKSGKGKVDIDLFALAINEESISDEEFNKEFNKEAFRNLCSFIEKSKSLKKLKLGGLDLDDEMSKSLFDAIKENQSLEVIGLRDCLSNEKDVFRLVDAIENKKHLRELVLDNADNDFVISNKSAQRLADFLTKDNCPLKTLIFYRCCDSNECVLAPRLSTTPILNALKNNSSLETLSLDGGCDLGRNDESVDVLIEALEGNKALRNLVIQSNALNDDDMLRVIRSNNKLTSLGIESNQITLEGLSSIKDFLNKNTTLLKSFYIEGFEESVDRSEGIDLLKEIDSILAKRKIVPNPEEERPSKRSKTSEVDPSALRDLYAKSRRGGLAEKMAGLTIEKKPPKPPNLTEDTLPSSFVDQVSKLYIWKDPKTFSDEYQLPEDKSHDKSSISENKEGKSR